MRNRHNGDRRRGVALYLNGNYRLATEIMSQESYLSANVKRIALQGQ
jgi:hypothetical protein